MGSSRGRRAPARDAVDAYGDGHFPGTGSAAQHAGHNPALKAGNPLPYVYDWANTWPGASAARSSAEEPTMADTKAEIVQYIIDYVGGYDEDDRAALEAMTKSALLALIP